MAVVPVKDLGRPVCVGDRAVIRSDLRTSKTYRMVTGYSIGISTDMLRFRDQEVIIDRIYSSGGGYKIIEDDRRWCWVDEMFEGVIVADEDFGEIDMPEDTTLDFLLGG